MHEPSSAGGSVVEAAAVVNQTSAREAAISLQQDMLSQLNHGGWYLSADKGGN